MDIPLIAFTVGLTQHEVKKIIDGYSKPFSQDRFIIVESKMNNEK